jgi:peptidoglycan/xylan/chitin deacetylase (PgdA/CDA1 family)
LTGSLPADYPDAYGTPRPAYYHSLAPFARWFTTGVPVLAYHKLGPRPGPVRLKGLYLSERLFQRQLAELRASGFVSRPLDEVCRRQSPTQPGIALTFDDGFVSVLRHGLEPLSRHGFTAIQFLVAERLGASNTWDAGAGEAAEPLMDGAQIREWLAAGHKIGSHTLSHPWLTRISAAAAREEIHASKRQLEDLFGISVEHFCYPYGDWNEAVRDLVQIAGYLTASTTEFGLNQEITSPWAIKRLTARYASRNLKAWWDRARRWLSGRHFFASSPC